MPPKTLIIRNNTVGLFIFTKQTGENGIEVRVQNGTICLSQKLMAALSTNIIKIIVLQLQCGINLEEKLFLKEASYEIR